jgi:hypothetical protein
VTDTLLFLHLLSAAALFTGIVAYSAVALGSALELRAARAFLALWHVGLVGVFLFGIALAIDIDDYQPWDPWILIALGLWLAAGGHGDKLANAYVKDGAGAASVSPAAVRAHWIHVVVVVLLLADMIWKPWA